MNQPHQLGDLQLAIMRELWTRGEASASDVHKALLDERGLAVTTVKTMLRKLEERGVVTHRNRGRQFIYRALVAEEDVRGGMVGDLLERLFQGDGAALVNHLLEAGEIDAAELDDLRARLARKRRKRS